MQQSPSTRYILDLDFQKELYQEDLKKLIINIKDKYKTHTETRRQQNELALKIIKVCLQKYDDEILQKKLELQELQQRTEDQKQEQDTEYSSLELELKNNVINIFLHFQKQYDMINAEHIKLEELVTKENQNNEYLSLFSTILQSLTDFELARESECINQQTFLALKSPNVHTKQHSKITHLNQYLSLLIQKIEGTEQRINNLNSGEKSEIQIILMQKISTLKQQLRQIQQTNHDLIQQLYDLQSDFLVKQRNFKNIRQILLNNQQKLEEQKNQEISVLQLQKGETEKNVKAFNQISTQQSTQLKDYEENIQRLIILSSSLIQSLNNSIGQFRQSLEYSTMTPDPKKSNFTSLQRISIINNFKKTIHEKNENEEETPLSYGKQLYYKRKPAVEKIGSIKTDENNNSSFIVNFKSSSQSPGFRSQLSSDKQTALPLKCSCPPECNCQQYVYSQLHSCNNPLYINQKGDILCQACQTSTFVGENLFYCQFNKSKNKFKTFNDFVGSFWKYLISLTLNQSIVEFWIGFVVNCKYKWRGGSPRLPALRVDDISVPFHSSCPQQSNCNHKPLLIQIHSTCNTPLLLTSYGDVVCRRCQYSMFIQFHFIQCQETSQYYSFQSADEFILQIDPYLKQQIRQDKPELNQFLQQLIVNLNKRWK